ncbi:hypothetical protein BJZ21_004036 [Nocardioides panaciterrulae]|uniref:Uncharacterized protein n=1 Tax=Nocardioides panaciterrulae TaxID=661492 RepID=A0A7Y9EA76_9ACTN|nr:hypothetical protein [Nocardioides panaciterrulae]NYD43953.1 hypothetical protein [Nocardioides panaciterrulae]
MRVVGEAVVHGIDRRTQEHLCGALAGLGTDALAPGMKITCPACVELLGAYR